MVRLPADPMHLDGDSEPPGRLGEVPPLRHLEDLARPNQGDGAQLAPDPDPPLAVQGFLPDLPLEQVGRAKPGRRFRERAVHL